MIGLSAKETIAPPVPFRNGGGGGGGGEQAADATEIAPGDNNSGEELPCLVTTCGVEEEGESARSAGGGGGGDRFPLFSVVRANRALCEYTGRPGDDCFSLQGRELHGLLRLRKKGGSRTAMVTAQAKAAPTAVEIPPDGSPAVVTRSVAASASASAGAGAGEGAGATAALPPAISGGLEGLAGSSASGNGEIGVDVRSSRRHGGGRGQSARGGKGKGKASTAAAETEVAEAGVAVVLEAEARQADVREDEAQRVLFRELAQVCVRVRACVSCVMTRY